MPQGGSRERDEAADDLDIHGVRHERVERERPQDACPQIGVSALALGHEIHLELSPIDRAGARPSPAIIERLCVGAIGACSYRLRRVRRSSAVRKL